jgi:hypothetical protein
MKVRFQGTLYDVQWRYSKLPVKFGSMRGRHILEQTVCTVCVVDDDYEGADKYKEVYRGVATQKYGDIPNRVLARKISLTRSLRSASKAFREAIWDVFKDECRVQVG